MYSVRTSAAQENAIHDEQPNAIVDYIIHNPTRMIGLSKTNGYAIQALRCLDDPACHRRSLADISCCSSVPRPYLAKIVRALARHGIVHARRGVGGGIWLARPPEEIRLLEIVEAIEGKAWVGECLLGLNDCASPHMTCPTHAFWQRIRREITTELCHVTLAEVIAARPANAPYACPSMPPDRAPLLHHEL